MKVRFFRGRVSSPKSPKPGKSGNPRRAGVNPKSNVSSPQLFSQGPSFGARCWPKHRGIFAKQMQKRSLSVGETKPPNSDLLSRNRLCCSRTCGALILTNITSVFVGNRLGSSRQCRLSYRPKYRFCSGPATSPRPGNPWNVFLSCGK